MRRSAVHAGVFVLILAGGLLLRPSGEHLAHLTATLLRERAQAASRRLREAGQLIQALLPRLAVYVSDALLGVGTVLAAFTVYLIVAVPVQIHLLQREVRQLNERLLLLSQDVSLATQLLTQMNPRAGMKQGIEQGAFVAKSPLGPSASEENPPA